MKKCRILGLFNNFDGAFRVISDIRKLKVPGVTIDDVTVMSPIEHPEIDGVLENRGSPVPLFTLCGGLFGLIFGFLFLAAAQATFLVQPQGGKEVITLPSNAILNYEMFILFSVLFTIAGFLISARLLRRRKSLYTEKISLDQVGIELEVEEQYIERIKDLFKQHKANEIRDEVIK